MGRCYRLPVRQPSYQAENEMLLPGPDSDKTASLPDCNREATNLACNSVKGKGFVGQALLPTSISREIEAQSLCLSLTSGLHTDF